MFKFITKNRINNLWTSFTAAAAGHAIESIALLAFIVSYYIFLYFAILKREIEQSTYHRGQHPVNIIFFFWKEFNF